MEHFDVLIVGAGLAGLRCAQLLGRAGLKVLLIDRKSRLDQSIHTTGIFVRRTLEDFYLPEECLGPPVRHVTLYSPARRTLELSSPHDQFRIGRMGLLYRRMLESCLSDGVEWMPQTRYAGYRAVGEKLIIELDTKAGSRTVGTRYLVGSDGAASRIAKDLGLDVNSEWIVGVEEVLGDVPLNGPPRLHCFIDPKLAPGYLAWVAHDGDEAHVGVGGYASKFDPLAALAKFRASLRNLVDLRSAKLIERRGGRIPVGGVLRRIANRHGLLVGDAAGAVSPLTAGGLDPCMRLSTLAAEVIVDFLRTGDPWVLNRYSGDLFRARFTSRLWMRRLISNVRQPAFIELACASLRLPLLNWFASHVFFGRGSFPDVERRLIPQPQHGDLFINQSQFTSKC
jgi:flavin-dependent dehydrogenase